MSPEFEEVTRRWLEESGELLIVIRFSHAAGSRMWRLFSDFATFQARIAELKPRTSVVAFRGRYLPLRGIIDEEFIARCLQEIPDGAWYLLVGLEARTAGKVSWFPHVSGASHADLVVDLRDDFGENVAVGLEPPWTDYDNSADYIVPHPNGLIEVGVY